MAAPPLISSPTNKSLAGLWETLQLGPAGGCLPEDAFRKSPGRWRCAGILLLFEGMLEARLRFALGAGKNDLRGKAGCPPTRQQLLPAAFPVLFHLPACTVPGLWGALG